MTMALVVILVSSGATGQTVYVFTAGGQPFGDWQREDHWVPFGRPIAGDTAVVPAGKTCRILNSDEVDAACAVLRVEANAPTRATLLVEDQRTLTITDDSVINGTMDLRGALLIGDNLVIRGTGGEIRGSLAALITVTPPGSNWVLTLGNNGPFPGMYAPREESLAVYGRLNLSARLQNDAYVIADVMGPENSLYLSGWSKNAGPHGYWIAEKSGSLVVQCEVTGQGKWQNLYVPGYGTAFITIGHPTFVSGDVLLETGVFIVNQQFCTSGNLLWHSVARQPPEAPGWTEPRIQLGREDFARFGVERCP